MKLLIWGGIILFAVLAGGVFAIWFYDEQHSLWADVLENDVILGASTIQGIHRLAMPEAKQALDQGDAVFVDVRSAYAYEAGHIPGALHLPLQTGTDHLRRELATHPNYIRIITYCSGGGCRSSYTLAKRLVKELIRSEVYVMTGGWPAWRAAGFPVSMGVETGP